MLPELVLGFCLTPSFAAECGPHGGPPIGPDASLRGDALPPAKTSRWRIAVCAPLDGVLGETLGQSAPGCCAGSKSKPSCAARQQWDYARWSVQSCGSKSEVRGLANRRPNALLRPIWPKSRGEILQYLLRHGKHCVLRIGAGGRVGFLKGLRNVQVTHRCVVIEPMKTEKSSKAVLRRVNSWMRTLERRIKERACAPWTRVANLLPRKVL